MELFCFKTRNGNLLIVSDKWLRNRVIKDSKKSSYNWIAPVEQLIKVCNKKGFNEECAIDIKITILKYYTDFLKKGIMPNDIIYAYQVCNGVYKNKEISKVRKKFIKTYIKNALGFISAEYIFSFGVGFELFYDEWVNKKTEELNNLEFINFLSLENKLISEFRNYVKKEKETGTFESVLFMDLNKFINETDINIAKAGIPYLIKCANENSVELVNDNIYSENDDEKAKLNREAKTIKHKNK